jgi:hypothetical protein
MRVIRSGGKTRERGRNRRESVSESQSEMNEERDIIERKREKFRERSVCFGSNVTICTSVSVAGLLSVTSQDLISIYFYLILLHNLNLSRRFVLFI